MGSAATNAASGTTARIGQSLRGRTGPRAAGRSGGGPSITRGTVASADAATPTASGTLVPKPAASAPANGDATVLPMNEAASSAPMERAITSRQAPAITRALITG